MATRHNVCVNPACKNNVTGWGGASTPAQATGLTGMSRTTGARYSSGTFALTANGAAAPGDVVTISLDVLSETGSDPSVDLYFETNATTVGAAVNFSLTAGVPTRVSITRTCPGGTTSVHAVVDAFNAGVSTLVITGVLIEVAPAADTYFDGDSVGGSWDGTNGNSASTLAGGITQAIGTATETDSALALSRRKTRTLGLAAETDTAQPFGRRKTRAVGVAAEADTALPLVRRKSRPLGVATSTETALPIGRRKTRTIGTAVEVDQALPFGGALIPQPGHVTISAAAPGMAVTSTAVGMAVSASTNAMTVEAS